MLRYCKVILVQILWSLQSGDYRGVRGSVETGAILVAWMGLLPQSIFFFEIVTRVRAVHITIHAVTQAPPRKRRLVTYTMQPLNEQPGHRFGVNRILRVGEDGLLSAGRDGVVRRWDVSSMLSRGGRGGSAGTESNSGVYYTSFCVPYTSTPSSGLDGGLCCRVANDVDFPFLCRQVLGPRSLHMNSSPPSSRCDEKPCVFFQPVVKTAEYTGFRWSPNTRTPPTTPSSSLSTMTTTRW